MSPFVRKGIFLCVVVFLSVPGLGLGNSQCPENFKEPVLSGLMSLALPGLGQVYTGAFGRAALYSSLSLASFWTGILVLGQPRVGFEGDFGLSLSFSLYRDDYRALRWAIAGVAAVSWLSIRIISAIDGVLGAQGYNDKIYDCYLREGQFPDILLLPQADGMAVAISLGF